MSKKHPRRGKSRSSRKFDAAQTGHQDGDADDSAAKAPRGGKSAAKTHATTLRIIGGSMRGRTVRYHGAAYTRPMKDSVRENLFNILGPAVRGAVGFDLFAGTGAIAFEAISRGANGVTMVEQSRHAMKTLKDSASQLGIEDRLNLIIGDTFRIALKLLGPPDADTPWVVFLCPPYRMWEDETTLGKLNQMIRAFLEHAPLGSVLVAETDKFFDTARLPAAAWDFREYGNVRLCFVEPAVICGMNL
ncbi:RsmD family RNA methyltransferase [Crateriforma conspicua]|uniref:Ribosomal RNA small subunit methyltransferase D n=1 Tax=Crateriforma conspicua TaxID=2527996 RepID=A0A5C5YAU3_9PLAN|nr:RsmD family RNA methyltransferase [Crateriforma conspicua]TWT72089.1 Ribosomal RNA small subunit methyltransferase D [Crateriforma conspicua]